MSTFVVLSSQWNVPEVFLIISLNVCTNLWGWVPVTHSAAFKLASYDWQCFNSSLSITSYTDEPQQQTSLADFVSVSSMPPGQLCPVYALNRWPLAVSCSTWLWHWTLLIYPLEGGASGPTVTSVVWVCCIWVPGHRTVHLNEIINVIHVTVQWF